MVIKYSHPLAVLLGGCLLWAITITAHAGITPDDIAVFSREGVQVIFPGETSRHTFAEDIAPDKLLSAEMIDFSGVTLGDKPDFFTWLAQFTNLRKLVLRNTHIHATPELLRAFVGMEKLQKLDLSENPLFDGTYSTTKLGSLWGNLPNLNELTLTATYGTVENYGSLVLLNNLHTLHLGNNPQLCARSLLGHIASWSGDTCLKTLELSKLPLVVLDLSKTGLTDDPLPDLPVATLRELSLENNGLGELGGHDLPQLEYWNLAGNPELELAPDFGSVLNLKALRSLHHDPTASIPAELRQRFARKGTPETNVPQPSTTIATAPQPTKPTSASAPVLQPKTSDEIQSWLAGADQAKHQAALDYLKTEAQTGDKSALHWLGQAHHKGWGMKRDWIAARNRYWQAFNSGDSTAKNSIDALDREAANAITEWGNSGKSTEKGRLAHGLYTTLAKTGNKNAQGWLDWLAKKH